MPTIRNKPIPVESRITVVLVSGECYQGTRLAPDPPAGFIRLLGLKQCGEGTPWHAVMIPVHNVKYILTEVDNAPGKGQSVSVHPAGQALSPDIVVEQRAEPPAIVALHYSDGSSQEFTKGDPTQEEVYPSDPPATGWLKYHEELVEANRRVLQHKPQGTALKKPEHVLEGLADGTFKAVLLCPCGGIDVMSNDTAGSQANPHRFDCPRGGKGYPDPQGTAMEDPNPRPEPEEDAERWSRHE